MYFQNFKGWGWLTQLPPHISTTVALDDMIPKLGTEAKEIVLNLF